MESAIVTGGAGFIGSNIANKLNKTGIDVTVVDNMYMGERSNLDDEITVEDESVVSYRIQNDVDIIYHLAALSSLAMHEDNPCRGCRVNVEGFVNMAEQARSINSDIVYASTSSIYGTHTNESVEGQEVTVKTAYEASKLSREKYSQYYNQYSDIDAIGLRLFSIYQGMRYNEGHKQQYANVISQFAERIYNDNRPVLYGDGTQTRDFTHVNDVVEAFILAGDAEPGIYNVGSGEVRSFNQIVTEINNQLDKSIEPEYVENPINDDVYVSNQNSCSQKFREETGWQPSISFEQGIKKVCESYK
jgi:UDP-glucose 4-epimerase